MIPFFPSLQISSNPLATTLTQLNISTITFSFFLLQINNNPHTPLDPAFHYITGSIHYCVYVNIDDQTIEIIV